MGSSAAPLPLTLAPDVLTLHPQLQTINHERSTLWLRWKEENCTRQGSFMYVHSLFIYFVFLSVVS
jgi:hypothetical protein